MTPIHKTSFIYKNSLTLVFLLLAVLAIGGQTLTGLDQYNNFLNEHNQTPVSLLNYLSTGHFIQATFENWESEFFQMALFVWFTVFLRQKGSSESKQLTGKEEVDRQPKKHAKAPWPVKRLSQNYTKRVATENTETQRFDFLVVFLCALCGFVLIVLF